MVANYDESLLPDMLPVYYSKLFPQNVFTRWLSCGSSPQPLAHRELSFTLADDVYLRYLSFSNQKELHALLQKKCPQKIDIGPVYNTKPAVARHGSVVQSRELVFDIDLTDYDEIRTCCQEAKVCQKCWKFMAIACEIIDTALREDFGFRNILWVFSGRRGIHCWVSDFEARTLDSHGRGAIADYLCLIVGGENQNKKVHFSSDYLHSSVIRAHKIVNNNFVDILKDQEFIAGNDGLKKMTLMIPDDNLATQVLSKLEALPPNSMIRWNAFQQIYLQYRKENKSWKTKHLLEEIQLQFCYPRLDVNVTKGSNHLLKSPFSIHPKTGKVCIVFKPSESKILDLNDVPTIYTLLDDNASGNKNHEITMKVALKHFQDVVFALEKEEAKRKRETDMTF